MVDKAICIVCHQWFPNPLKLDVFVCKSCLDKQHSTPMKDK
jgi:hypothetical protein